MSEQMQDNPIYKFMKANDLTKLDEKAFMDKYSAPDKAKEIHSFMVSNKLTDLDDAKFYDKYLKKKVGGEVSSLTESKSPSQDYLSKGQELADKGFIKTEKLDPSQLVSQYRSPDISLTPKPKKNYYNDKLEKGLIFDKEGKLYEPSSEALTKSITQAEQIDLKKSTQKDLVEKSREMPIEEEAVPVEKQGWLLNTVSALDKGFAKNFISSPIKGLGTVLQGATKKVMGGTGEGYISDNLIKFGDYLNNAIDELTPQDEEFKNTLWDQAAQALGQVGSLVFTGGLAGAGKGATAALVSEVPKGAVATATKALGSQLASPTAVSAGLSMGQAEFDRAKDAGATDDQAFEAFYKNAATGSVLETIPVMQFFKRFNNSTGGSVANYIKTKGVAGLTGGIEEMTTEVMQQLYSNKTAKDIYNINQDILDGVGSSGGVGFGVGFLLNAMGANAKILRKQGKAQEAAVLENQVKQYEDNLENPKITSNKEAVTKDIVTQGVEIGTQKAVQSLDRDLANNVITPEQYQEGIVFTEKAAQVVDKIPETVTGESKVKSVELLVERNDIKEANQILLQQKQTTDEAYHAGIDQEIKANEERIKKIDSEVYNIAKKPSKEFGTKTYVVDGEEVSKEAFEALTGKPLGAKKVIKPTQEQQFKDTSEGNLVTFTYKSESEVPDVFKDKIINRGENKIGLFGKKESFVRVTVPQSLADYELAKTEPTEVKIEDVTSKQKNEKFDTPTLKSPASNYEKLYVPRNVLEEAYKNDKDNNPVLGGGGQSLETIIKRGGYSIEELNNLLPNWKDIASVKEVKPTEVIEKDNNGNFLPKKFTLNKAAPVEEQAPSISIESIKEESFGGEMPTDVKQVKLLEIRGRNADGVTVGTVWIQSEDGSSFTAEVKFNDEKLSTLEIKPTEVKQPTKELAEGESVEFNTPEGNKIIGERVIIPGFEKIDMVIVKDGLNNTVYDLASGTPLAEGDFTKENAIKSIKEQLDARNITQDKIYNLIYKSTNTSSLENSKNRVPQINPSSMFESYSEKRKAFEKAEYEKLPLKFNPEEIKKLKELKKRAEDFGIDKMAKEIEDAIISRAKEGTFKPKTDYYEGLLKKDIDQKIKKEAEDQGVPYPKEYMKETPRITMDKLKKIVNEGFKRDKFDSIPEDVRKIMLEGYQKNIDILNKYGYYPDENTKIFFDKLYQYVAAQTKRENRESQIADAKKELISALDYLNKAHEKEFGKKVEAEVKPKEGEVKVYNAKDLKNNPEILKEDEDYASITYPKSFSSLYTDMFSLKNNGYEKAKIGDVINIFKKDYVIEAFGENKKNPDKTVVKLIRVDENGNILRIQDLSKKEKKSTLAKEFEEEEEIEVEEAEELTKDDLKKAEAKFAAAEDKFKKARNKIEATQVKQAGMFGGEQKGMFAMGGAEAKSTLDPLRKAAKEAKAELDDIRNRIKVQEVAQPELAPIEPSKKTYQEAVKEKLEADKKRNREAGAERATFTKEIYRRVNQMDAPADAEQVALRYLADGGKVSKEAVDEAYGSVKRAQLNVKRRVLLSEEVKSKDFVQGNETLDETAHRLWEANKQKIPESEIKDKLMAEIGNTNSRLEAAEAYLDKYNAEYKQEKEELRLAEQYKEQYLEEQAEIEKELRQPLDEQIEGEATEEHINNLINQYEAEIKGEDQQLRPESEGDVSKEAGKRKVAEKASETELAKEYKEVVGKAGKKAKENAKKEFVDRNFENIVEKLKIQIKCPT